MTDEVSFNIEEHAIDSNAIDHLSNPFLDLAEASGQILYLLAEEL
jgi:hypothetical protein